MTKGIILGAGTGKRLWPITKLINKHFLNIYNKPMIYYPLSILILNNVRDILIVCNKDDLKNYKILLRNGEQLGIKITYKIQKKANGIVGAMMDCEKFIGKDNFLLMLGDNFFYGNDLNRNISKIIEDNNTPTVFTYNVSNYMNFGIVEYSKNKTIKKIHEKPNKQYSNNAVLGMYYLDKNAFFYGKKLKKSKRGEYEISDLFNIYLKNKKKIYSHHLGRGFTWFDMGTYDDFINASLFVKIIEERQNLSIGSINEAAFVTGLIDRKKFNEIEK
tara:strand:+ start:3563 stop:4384 length:822 start_codon:yes stop_codon:yes gene_type:complete